MTRQQSQRPPHVLGQTAATPRLHTDSYVAPASWSAGDDDGHRRARPRRRLKPEREPGAIHLRHQRIRQGVTGPPSPSGPTAPRAESKSPTSKAAWPPTAPKTTAGLSVRPAAPSPITTTDATKFLARPRQAHRQEQARRRLRRACLRDQLPRLGRAQVRVFRQAPSASPGASHRDPKCLAQRISPARFAGAARYAATTPSEPSASSRRYDATTSPSASPSASPLVLRTRPTARTTRTQRPSTTRSPPRRGPPHPPATPTAFSSSTSTFFTSLRYFTHYIYIFAVHYITYRFAERPGHLPGRTATRFSHIGK